MLAENATFHNKSKHIDIKYHYIRELLDKKVISITYINTNENIADIMTKSLNHIKHHSFTKGILES